MATRSPAKAPAPSTKPTAPPAPAASRPLPAAALAPSTKQAGGAAVKLGGETPAGDDLAPGVMDLKTMGGTFKPPAPIAAFLDGRQRSRVSTRFGKLADGAIEVETRAKGKYQVRNQRLALSHPLFARIGEAAPGLAPCIEVNVASEKIEGRVGFAAGAKLDAFDAQIGKAPELLGLVGISLGTLSGVVNSIAGGKLKVGLSGVPITLGQAFSGKVTLIAEDETITFDASATINVKGLATGNLEMKRTADGLITGKAAVGLQLPKNLSGSVDVAWDGRAVSGEGKVGYKGEKLSGDVTLRLMERAQAQQLEEQKKAPPEQAPPAPSPAAAKAAKKIDYVVFGEGDLAFAFNAWLNGTAHVIVDPKGYVTIIGKITPQQEFELFPQKDYVKPLFKVEIRASYGIPVVGNIFIFANVGMDAFAKLGPAKFYKIIVQGTYSTDPTKARDFSIQGTLNISAAAGARLRGEAGAGLEVLGHDIKAGAGVNGIAGIKGYAEATPTIGYREKAAPGEDRKGEWFIRGDLEIVGQPFLGLSGDLFVEIDAPWWSPVPDKKWTWPLGGKEWPLGSPLGIGASIDYVFGSGQWPKLDLKPVEFSADKFMADLYADKAKSGKGGDVEQPGKWNDKNSKASDPPAKSSPKGNATAGKAPALSPAKSRVQPGGTGKGGKHADPNARTATGKSVKQYQDEAVKKGSKPAGGEVKGQPSTSQKAKNPEMKFPEKKFNEGKKEHKLWVKSENGVFVPMISSQTQHLSDFLKAAEAENLPKKNKDKIPDAEKLLEAFESALSKSAGSDSKKLLATTQQAEEKLAVALTAILDDVNISKFKEIYKLEGLVATYSRMPRQTNDLMTPDHQPQAQLLGEVAKFPFFENTELRRAAGGKHADGALTINLHRNRHTPGRTYGRSNLVGPVIGEIENDTQDPRLTKEDKQALALKHVEKELKKDVTWMKAEVLSQKSGSTIWRDIHNDKPPSKKQKELIETITKQVDEGENRIQQQDLARYQK